MLRKYGNCGRLTFRWCEATAIVRWFQGWPCDPLRSELWQNYTNAPGVPQCGACGDPIGFDPGFPFYLPPMGPIGGKAGGVSVEARAEPQRMVSERRSDMESPQNRLECTGVVSGEEHEVDSRVRLRLPTRTTSAKTDLARDM
jgi:hypothetical protein